MHTQDIQASIFKDVNSSGMFLILSVSDKVSVLLFSHN